MRSLFLVAALLVGCAPQIGDSCNISSDCSVNGDRICDLAYPNGYCTVLACDPDTCPGGSTCVEWRFMPDRTAVTYCMDLCDNDGDCRAEYRCMTPVDERLRDEDGSDLARVIDLEGRDDPHLCVAVQAAE